MFQRTRKPAFAIAFVCALHELQRTLVVRSGKRLKIQIYPSEVYNKCNKFPEGASPLRAGVTTRSVNKSQAGYWRQ